MLETILRTHIGDNIKNDDHSFGNNDTDDNIA